VTGSLPPEGRDLDLWLTAPARDAVSRALEAEGFVARDHTWARFGPLELVDLELLEDESMLERATPLPGCRHVCRPDAADGLRLLATAYARDGQLTPSRRARATQPEEVWDAARSRGDAASLESLAEALAVADPTPRLPVRVRGRVRRMRQAGVITLSGVDGSGKSTQAALLRDTLTAAGFEATVEWNRLSHDRWLDALARPVKKLLRRGEGEAPREPTGGSGRGTPRGARGLWVVVVAIANAVAHNRSVRGHLLAGRVVICDRYTLDSTVQLSTDYPPGRGNRLAVALVRWLSPRPVASFYLAVPPEAAAARKEWEGSPERLHRHARGYEEHWARLGVRRVDSTRPVDDVAAEIVTEVWRRL
jgi:thymidylate kinase